MEQYMAIKEQNKDCILFYRLGDFYEMFFDDALTASRELEITLTGKNCGMEERAPMCGVPFHGGGPETDQRDRKEGSHQDRDSGNKYFSAEFRRREEQLSHVYLLQRR